MLQHQGEVLSFLAYLRMFRETILQNVNNCIRCIIFCHLLHFLFCCHSNGGGRCLLDEPPQRILSLPIEEPGEVFDANDQCSFVYGKGVSHCNFIVSVVEFCLCSSYRWSRVESIAKLENTKKFCQPFYIEIKKVLILLSSCFFSFWENCTPCHLNIRKCSATKNHLLNSFEK